MKNIATSALLAFALFLSTSQISAQNQTVWLDMQQLMNSEKFALNTSTALTPTKQHKITRLQFYISGIAVIHDGGQEAVLTDLYFLINPATDSVFNLGQLPFTNIEGIKFSVGVDKDHNHLDPASYATGHPLAPKSPEMHWGWASGYRFVALEGDADGANGPATDHFELHALGDNNYLSQTILTPGKTEADGIHLKIKADYVRLLDGISTTGGFIAHTLSGKAITCMKNAQAVVFSAAVVSGICCDATTGYFVMAPNPTTESATILYDFSSKTAQVEMRVFDASCRPVFSTVLENATGQFEFETAWSPGVYFIEFNDRNGRFLRSEKLIVR